MKVGIKVGDVMTRKFVSVKSNVSVRDCAKLMMKKHVGSLIISDGQKLSGILTEGDILLAVAKGIDMKKTNVAKIMTKKVIGINPSKDIYDALALMKSRKVRWLPILADGNVIGFLTEKDILKLQPIFLILQART